ncbi:MAG: penicillin-binding protein 2 [Prevotellaceae bacterium]|jgi:penicillin-binding protein 2|nr:penicillin-binding protein 2 [Prevotellaceae bacterium]
MQKRVIIVIFLISALVLVIRLFQIQVLDDSYKVTALNNAFRYEVQYPARGLIYDRNKDLLVENKTTYDIMIIPRELKAFDTTELCSIFQIGREQADAEFKKLTNRRAFQAVPFLKQVSAELCAGFLEKEYKFPGFYAQARTLRVYPHKVTGNLLGYIQEADSSAMKKDSYYKSGDYIGKSGIEESYEQVLRGQKGESIYLRDIHNQIKGSYAEGEYDKQAVAGYNLITTIDVDLQEYGQLLMQNKLGSVVAIEPATGEVLAMISSPGFDPATMSGLNRRSNYIALRNDPTRPLFDRTIMSSTNPPGSVFKIVNGMVGLQEGVLRSDMRYPCAGGYPYGRGVKCHAHFSPINMIQSIQVSCNAYYCYVFRNIIENPKYPSLDSALNSWRAKVQQLGFGRQLGIDLPNEKGGILPTTTLYDKIHGKGRWKALSIISLSIGQGEIGATTLQLANLCAIIANRGFYYIPHIVKEIESDSIAIDIDPKYKQLQKSGINHEYFDDIVQGMYLAVNGGAGSTARRVRLPDIEVCGKTGTAQNPHGKDNAVFICFAPRENPKIAIAVYVENAGFGGTHAAPIAALMVEKYLKGKITRTDLEIQVLSSNFIQHLVQK